MIPVHRRGWKYVIRLNTPKAEAIENIDNAIRELRTIRRQLQQEAS